MSNKRQNDYLYLVRKKEQLVKILPMRLHTRPSFTPCCGAVSNELGWQVVSGFIENLLSESE